VSTNETTVAPVRVIARLARIFESRLGEESMTLPQFRVLAFLSEGEGAASALADWLSVSRPSVTTLVDGLVEKGWVVRATCADDRRRVLHHLTDAGRARVETAGDHLGEALDDLLGHLDDEERTRAVEGLELLGEAMRRSREQAVASR
jgi:long-chain acyl-CoA synthetase